MTDLTAAQQEAYARAKTSIVELWCAEFRHPSLVNPLRHVQGDADITITLEANAPVDANQPVLFQALDFDFDVPVIDKDPARTANIKIKGASGTVLNFLTAAQDSLTPIAATLRVIIYDTQTQTVVDSFSPIHLEQHRVEVTALDVTIKLAYVNAANRQFPFTEYDIHTNPGLA